MHGGLGSISKLILFSRSHKHLFIYISATHRRTHTHAPHIQAIVSLDRGTTKAPRGLYALSLDLPLPTASALSDFADEDKVSAALAHGEAGMRIILEAMSQYFTSTTPLMPLWLTTTTPEDPVRMGVRVKAVDI